MSKRYSRKFDMQRTMGTRQKAWVEKFKFAKVLID